MIAFMLSATVKSLVRGVFIVGMYDLAQGENHSMGRCGNVKVPTQKYCHEAHSRKLIDGGKIKKPLMECGLCGAGTHTSTTMSTVSSSTTTWAVYPGPADPYNTISDRKANTRIVVASVFATMGIR